MMTVYRNHYHTGDFVLSDGFIEQNHLYLTERIIRRFQLPQYLHEMIMTNCFVLERSSYMPKEISRLKKYLIIFPETTLASQQMRQNIKARVG